MNCPNQRHAKGDAQAHFGLPLLRGGCQQLFGGEEQRHRGAGVDKDAGEMPAPRLGEAVNLVVENETQPLDRAVKTRRRGIEKQEMPEALGDKPPTADERIAQDQRRVVPDKTIAQGGPVNEKSGRNDQQHGSGSR